MLVCVHSCVYICYECVTYSIYVPTCTYCVLVHVHTVCVSVSLYVCHRLSSLAVQRLSSTT